MPTTYLKNSIFNTRMLACIGLGFSSGLPLYIIYTMIPAWLRSESISLKEIGLFALVGIPYTWKFLWSPFVDRYCPPFLGRRRGWMLISQIILLFVIAAMGFVDPSLSLKTIVILSVCLAFFSATQDIVLDAYRRELLSETELGLGNAVYVNAYRISGLIPGSLALILSEHMAWIWVFHSVAAFMLLGILTTLLVKEIPSDYAPTTLKQAVVHPFRDFIQRLGWLGAIEVIAFMFLYKLGDNMATALATPFYIDMGYSLEEVGLIAKNAGLWPLILGSLLGGLAMIKIGINRALLIFGVIQWLSILGFAWLAQIDHNLWALGSVIALEALGVGLGTAAFVAFIAKTTNPVFAATQFALLTALAAIPRTFVNATTGFIVEAIGWPPFFYLCAALAIPGLLLVFRVAPWNAHNEN